MNIVKGLTSLKEKNGAQLNGDSTNGYRLCVDGEYNLQLDDTLSDFYRIFHLEIGEFYEACEEVKDGECDWLSA